MTATNSTRTAGGANVGLAATERTTPYTAAPTTSPALAALRGMLAFPLRYWGFFLFVVFPVLFGVIYFGFIQANIYESTAQILVKSANQSSSLTGLGSFLQSTGITTTPNDAYTVNSYLASRDALRELEKDPGIRAIYDRPEADFLTRFPNLFFGRSFENLYGHYQNWIKVDFDTSSNITTLVIDTFRPRDSQAIGARLISLSEAEVNRLNARVLDDALRGARREVSQLQDRSIAIQNEITAFRTRDLMLNPTQSSTDAVTLQSTLESDLVNARAALQQLQVAAPHSPQLPALRSHIIALDAQVADEAQKGGGGDGSLAPKLSEYQQMLLRQQFLQTMLQSAVTALEAAEATVQQQQLYLAQVAVPSLPDRPLNNYVFRVVAILVVIFTTLIIYWIGRMIFAVIRDHLA